jgi:hypothetical protein
MKSQFYRLLSGMLLVISTFWGCTESNDFDPANPQTHSSALDNQHGLGLNLDLLKNNTEFAVSDDFMTTKSATLPVAFSLPTPPVREQGNLASGTGFVGAEATEILYFIKSGRTKWTPLSPLFIYYNERKLDGTIPEDAGSTIVTLCGALNKYGACREITDPYIVAWFQRTPTTIAYTEAKKYKTGANYTNLFSGSSYSTLVTKAKTELKNGRMVMAGIILYQSFLDLNSRSYRYSPDRNTEMLLGGQAVLIVGWDDKQNAFIAMNSWGTGWGNKGFFQIPYSVFPDRDLVVEIYSISL